MERYKYTSIKAYNQGEKSRSEIYNFVCLFIKENGYSPSLKEIAAAVGLHFSSVKKHLDILVANGGLFRGSKGCRRTLEIPKE